ncbi:hypothetical protein O1611_g1424 [Lasiodiplodia mahajangana]|uniref:Uncharacterized protein n=1 Tax=Lasiodiplodia mahajangana TaxID=1108764 RepID=A0ACC2JYC3_9PEZI|nr:hypothetical protein O1611_g1424 [Lasiodiplodia mahajangana]
MKKIPKEFEREGRREEEVDDNKEKREEEKAEDDNKEKREEEKAEDAEGDKNLRPRFISGKSKKGMKGRGLLSKQRSKHMVSTVENLPYLGFPIFADIETRFKLVTQRRSPGAASRC